MAATADGIDEVTASRVERNIELLRRQLFAIIEDPSLLDRIPNGGEIVLIPDDDAELAEANLEGGMRKVRAGKDITFIHVPAARDETESADIPAKTLTS